MLDETAASGCSLPPAPSMPPEPPSLPLPPLPPSPPPLVSITVRSNVVDEWSWLQLSEVEVFGSGIVPSSSTDISANRVTDVTYSHSVGSIAFDDPAGALVNGVRDSRGFGLPSSEGPGWRRWRRRPQKLKFF